jgi:hypothetical protein
MGREINPKLTRIVSSPPSRSNSPSLKNPQKLYLSGHRQFRNLIEKMVPLFARSNRPRYRATAPVTRSALVAKKFTLDDGVSGSAPQFTATNG